MKHYYYPPDIDTTPKPKPPVYPSYCCQKCGEEIGWLGRFFQWLRVSIHKCKDG